MTRVLRDALTLLRQLVAREPLTFTQTPWCAVCVRTLVQSGPSPRLGHAPDCPWLVAWTYLQAHQTCEHLGWCVERPGADEAAPLSP